MKKRFAAGWTALVVAGLAVSSGPALALSARMPDVQRQGAVAFVTGGIGRTEARLFERRMFRYPLAIELLEHAGRAEAFTGAANVTIADASGRKVLDARAGGPFMLVDLPSGRYSIVATLGHARLRKSTIDIRQGRLARATFEFPSHTD
jgi:hypothetical protein